MATGSWPQACELTKLYEEIQRGTAAELLARFVGKKPRGEFTLVIAGSGQSELPAARSRQGGEEGTT